MKLAISNIAWKEEDDIEVYGLMQKYGFTGLEIAPTRVFHQYPYNQLLNAKKWSQGIGFEVPSMQSIWYGINEQIFNTKKEREYLINYTKFAIDFACAIGCKNLVFGCPKNRNINDESDYKVAINFFQRIGYYAFLKNTAIGMEANPAIYNTNFINDTQSAIKLVHDVNSSGFMLNLDIGTMICNNESADVIKGQVRKINHVHISEPYLEPIKERELHKEVIEILKAEGYRKYISIEMKTQTDLAVIEKSMEYLKEITSECSI